MKRLIIAAVGLALVAGIILGCTAGNLLNFKASASATAGQQGEAQIALIADGQGIVYGYPPNTWLFLTEDNNGSPDAGPFLVALDSADYPANSTVQLETVLKAYATECVRLTEDRTAIDETETCHTSPSPAVVRVRSAPVPLASGEHEYSIQGKTDGNAETLYAARIIVDWTNSSVVGGVAEPPDLATRTGASGIGGGTYAVLGAAGGVLAITVAGTVAARRRGSQQ